ncbi:MAG: isoprenylcysteine carboxylmethyltransferase family protein [Devosia sp.]
MRDRVKAIAGSIVFLLVAPGIVAGVIPWSISTYHFGAPLFGLEPLRWLGILFLALGAILLVETFARFAIEGLGTPAPIAPTRTLIVTGSYRFVRNPMYVAVVSLILGQALLFGNWGVLAYGAMVWLTVHLFVLTYEEPTLQSTYGVQYDTYCRHVHRWIPRPSPYRQIVSKLSND